MEINELTKKIEKKIYFEVSYNDFDKLVKSVYNIHNYEFVADEELMNDICKTYHIKKEELDEWDVGRLEEFLEKNGSKSYMASTLLTDMCNKDIIEPGNYLISVSW